MDTPTHRKHLLLSAQSKGRFAGLRSVAVPSRQQAEETLQQGGEVVFDFAGLAVTQSFVDELIGALILRHGPDILDRIVFKNCSDDTRAIIEFVAADRCDQCSSARPH
jgi:hypothetical protein